MTIYGPGPYIDPKINRRLGYKTPRSILLPPYLAFNQYYVDYTNAMDAVYGPTIDSKIDILANIRNMWVTNPAMEQKVLDHEMLVPFDWSQPERALLVKQVNLLGMKLQTAGIVSDTSYQTIARFVGQYWFQKGTQAFISFINFCLSSNLQAINLWTDDYVNFVEVGDPSIGTPIWQGGTWYPTTHVTISANAGDLANVDLVTLTTFFYEIANYNLVLNNIDSSYKMEVVANLGDLNAQIVAMGFVGDTGVVISNLFSYGASAPPIQNTMGALPTTYLAPNGTPVNFANTFVLGQPSAWATDFTGKKLPVYSTASQAITSGASIGSNVMADVPASQYSILYGPVTWIPVPGSSLSTARIPAYSTNSFTVIPNSEISTYMVGLDRSCVLANPVGFTELSPGLFTPYW